MNGIRCQATVALRFKKIARTGSSTTQTAAATPPGAPAGGAPPGASAGRGTPGAVDEPSQCQVVIGGYAQYSRDDGVCDMVKHMFDSLASIWNDFNLSPLELIRPVSNPSEPGAAGAGAAGDGLTSFALQTDPLIGTAVLPTVAEVKGYESENDDDDEDDGEDDGEDDADVEVEMADLEPSTPAEPVYSITGIVVSIVHHEQYSRLMNGSQPLPTDVRELRNDNEGTATVKDYAACGVDGVIFALCKARRAFPGAFANAGVAT